MKFLFAKSNEVSDILHHGYGKSFENTMLIRSQSQGLYVSMI